MYDICRRQEYKAVHQNNMYVTTKNNNNNNNNCFMAISPGLPGEAGTRRNIHQLHTYPDHQPTFIYYNVYATKKRIMLLSPRVDLSNFEKL